MARYLLPGLTTGKTHNIERKPTTYLCDFKFPESVIDTTPYAELKPLGGKWTLQFYDAVKVGDRIEYEGHIWKAISRTHYPYRPYSKRSKKVSEIDFEYISRIPPSDDS